MVDKYRFLLKKSLHSTREYLLTVISGHVNIYTYNHTMFMQF